MTGTSTMIRAGLGAAVLAVIAIACGGGGTGPTPPGGGGTGGGGTGGGGTGGGGTGGGSVQTTTITINASGQVTPDDITVTQGSRVTIINTHNHHSRDELRPASRSFRVPGPQSMGVHHAGPIEDVRQSQHDSRLRIPRSQPARRPTAQGHDPHRAVGRALSAAKLGRPLFEVRGQPFFRVLALEQPLLQFAFEREPSPNPISSPECTARLMWPTALLARWEG